MFFCPLALLPLCPLAQMHPWLENIITFIYPARCRCCDKQLGVGKVHYICDECWKNIELITMPYCDICGRLMIPNAMFARPDGTYTCRWCLRNPPEFSKVRSIAYYDDAIREAIILFKKRKVMAKHLSEFIAEHAPALLDLSEYDNLVPIPLHKRRHRERGYNQAELLAQSFEKFAQIPVLTNNVIRIKYTEQQRKFKSNREKRENVEGVFRVKHPEEIKDATILLIDDVLTTGATVSEIAGTLLNAGANRVDVFTIARAGQRRS